jgi:N-acetylglucosaminyldiphosphoundecaprenol N-acetyl-beta-D-mannosaminyltransferase
MAQIPISNYKRQNQLQGGKPVSIQGITIHTLPVGAVIDYIDQAIIQRQKAIIAYVNVHAINLAQDVPWFRDFLNQADLTYCDGFGLKWGARLLGGEIPERFTPPDWFPQLAVNCAKQGFSFYFLGARPGIADKAAHQLKLSLPALKIMGVQHGYFDKTPDNPENETIINDINQTKADILVVGFGMPLQERWINENWEQIDARVALPVGALFDYLAHEIPRAPYWMTENGLEWLGRLIIEPGRLWKRYLVGNPRFLLNVIRERYSKTSHGQ